MVDSSCRFLAVSAFRSCATHDSVALKMSNMGNYMGEGNVPKGFWVAGDEAYLCEDYLLTPFKQEFLVPYTD